MAVWAEFMNIWELCMDVEGIWRDMWTQDKHIYLKEMFSINMKATFKDMTATRLAHFYNRNSFYYKRDTGP